MIGAIVGTVAESWSEVRVHKARFILSAFGVFLAVIMMTTVQAVGTMGMNMLKEQTEQATGRPGTITVFVHDDSLGQQGPAGQAAAKVQQYKEELTALAKRFEATHYTLVSTDHRRLQLSLGDRAIGEAQVNAVEPYYADLHRLPVTSGRFILPSDADQRAVQAVVNPRLADELGVSLPLTKPVTLRMSEPTQRIVTIVGVVGSLGDIPQMWVHIDQAMSAMMVRGAPSLEMWAGPQRVDDFLDLYSGDVDFIAGVETSVQRTDDAEFLQFLNFIPWIIRVAALIALGLTSIGVLNVGIVTVRNRVREIGIRRSYGATDQRVFATIMLESVLSSFVAALAGVAVSVAILRLPWHTMLPGELYLTSMPAFPVSVAVEAVLLASTVGALAGLIPAAIAVRAKVIEAIRF